MAWPPGPPPPPPPLGPPMASLDLCDDCISDQRWAMQCNESNQRACVFDEGCITFKFCTS